MHPAIPRLIDLQTIDLKIAGLRAQLDAFPKRIMDLDAKLTGARTSVASAAPSPAVLAAVEAAAAVSGLLLLSEVEGRKMRCGGASGASSSGRTSTRASADVTIRGCTFGGWTGMPFS